MKRYLAVFILACVFSMQALSVIVHPQTCTTPNAPCFTNLPCEREICPQTVVVRGYCNADHYCVALGSACSVNPLTGLAPEGHYELIDNVVTCVPGDQK